MRRIDYIVIHCTAGPQMQQVESIRRYWQSIGWRRPGYHRIIGADGKVYQLAPYSDVTNGVSGFNSHSIHIAYMGGVDSAGRPVDNRTPEQRATMERLVREARALFPRAKIQGHRDFSPDKNRDGIIQPNEWIKACPSFSVRTWLREIGI
jgi:N-acetylmuramoyl-L-alanine amidase